MLNVLVYKKRRRILKFYIIYKVLNIAIRSNSLYILYIKILIDKA